jgi:hypothetical protein
MDALKVEPPTGDGRRCLDRRGTPTSPLDAFRLAGKRARVRRRAERKAAFYLDRFDAFTLGLIVSLLVLTIVDGILTIELLDLNSDEYNPLMSHLLTRGRTAFFLGKYILTAAGLPFLLIFQNYPMFGSRFRVGYLFPIFLALYLVLLGYQLLLLQRGRIVPAVATGPGPPVASGGGQGRAGVSRQDQSMPGSEPASRLTQFLVELQDFAVAMNIPESVPGDTPHRLTTPDHMNREPTACR